MRNRPDPYAGFGHAETPGLTWREILQDSCTGLATVALLATIAWWVAPMFLALTRMF